MDPPKRPAQWIKGQHQSDLGGKTMLPNLKEKLTAIEDRIRGLREERARAASVAEAAKVAVDAVKSIEAKIEDAHEEQVDLLHRLGSAEAGLCGWTVPGRLRALR
jgi:hypothetical protein